MAVKAALSQDSAQKLATWYDEPLLNTTPILQRTFFGWLFGRFNQAGVTIRYAIHLTPKAPADITSPSSIALIGHEMYHVVQQHEMGWWSFLMHYVWHWRPKHIKRGEEHPLEKPAYERQREITQALSN